jgi:hypothetical protein
VLWGYHAVKGGDYDVTWRGRNNKKRKLVSVCPTVHEIHQRRNRTFQANPPTGFDEMFPPYAAKFWVMSDQISEFTALLHEIASGKSRDAFFESRYTE